MKRVTNNILLKMNSFADAMRDYVLSMKYDAPPSDCNITQNELSKVFLKILSVYGGEFSETLYLQDCSPVILQLSNNHLSRMHTVLCVCVCVCLEEAQSGAPSPFGNVDDTASHKVRMSLSHNPMTYLIINLIWTTDLDEQMQHWVLLQFDNLNDRYTVFDPCGLQHINMKYAMNSGDAYVSMDFDNIEDIFSHFWGRSHQYSLSQNGSAVQTIVSNIDVSLPLCNFVLAVCLRFGVCNLISFWFSSRVETQNDSSTGMHAAVRTVFPMNTDENLQSISLWCRRLACYDTHSIQFWETLGLLRSGKSHCWCFDPNSQLYCMNWADDSPFCEDHLQRLHFGPAPANAYRIITTFSDEFMDTIENYLFEIQVHPGIYNQTQGADPNSMNIYRSTPNVRLVANRIVTAYVHCQSDKNVPILTLINMLQPIASLSSQGCTDKWIIIHPWVPVERDNTNTLEQSVVATGIGAVSRAPFGGGPF